MRGHGIGEDPGGHTRRRRRVEDVRPADDKGDPGRGIHPSDGQVQDRSLRGGPDPPGDRDRLYRRERGAIPGGRRPPHRQAQVRRALRMRGQGSRRGPQAHRRGRIHDQDQGRARHRRCDPGGLAHAHHEQADQGAEGAGGTSTPSPCRSRWTWRSRYTRRAGSPSSTSPPAASPRPRMRRS